MEPLEPIPEVGDALDDGAAPLLATGLGALAPATVDSDADGVPDTAVLSPPGGVVGLATDLDGDRAADVLTTVEADGSARTVELDAPPPAWEPGWDGAAPPPSLLDPATGAWTRQV